MIFTIDIVDSCNLACLSCPRGHGGGKNTHYMSLNLLDKILNKAQKECTIHDVRLHDWGEPFLHPQLPEIIKLIKSYNISCRVSSNLSFKNINLFLEKISVSGLDKLLVSVSGFKQNQYQRNHKRGDIEIVKDNLKFLYELSKHEKHRIKEICINYHHYKDNWNEALLFKQFADFLGFKIVCYPAYLLPIETAMNEYKTSHVDTSYGNIHKYIIKLPSGLKSFLSENKLERCPYLFNRVSIDSYGRFKLCCATFDEQFTFGYFLDFKMKDIQRIRTEQIFCRECCRMGLPSYYLKHIEWRDIKNV